MRLCKFEIRNFKGIQNASFEWQGIVVLIGENNAGKSSVLQALQLFLGGSQIKDPLVFRQHVSSEENAIELIGHFDNLSEAERQSTAVRTRMVGGKWILKKVFWSETTRKGALDWKEAYYSFSQAERLKDWPENEGAWANFPQVYQPLIERIPGRGARPSDQSRELLKAIVREHRPDLIELDEPTWIPNPGGGGNWKSNANSIVPRCIYVKAVHNASDEATSKETSAYGKIVSLIVEKKLLQRPEIIELKRQIETVLRLFTPDPNHPEIQAEEIRSLQERINERLSEIIGGTVAIRTSEIDIEPMLLPSTHLLLRDGADGLDLPPEHQGHGLQRTLVMTLLQILAEIQSEPIPNDAPAGDAGEAQKAVILAVEEPELYMHPQMERRMRDVLYRLSTQPNFQVICTTHSAVFIDVERSHRALIKISKDEQKFVHSTKSRRISFRS